MEKIKRVWFDKDFIHMESTESRMYKLPLSGSSRLLNATPEQRLAYTIELDGTALRWDEIDEDIFITSFYDHPDGTHNKIAELFFKFPMLSISGMAKFAGINKNLLSQFIYGMKKPDNKQQTEILEAFNNLGADLASVTL